jgi:NAD+ diphosphatase
MILPNIVDWNLRNQFCPACGRRTVSAEAGHKRICPPQAGPADESVPCISSKGVHNFAYPRTGNMRAMIEMSSKLKHY